MGCGQSSSSKNKEQPVRKANKGAFSGQGVAVGGGNDYDDRWINLTSIYNPNRDQRQLRAEAAEKRLQESNQKGFSKASYAEVERKKKLMDEMDKERAQKGDNYNMRWNK